LAGFEYFVFCVIDVFERVVEKIFEKFGLLGHRTIPLGLGTLNDYKLVKFLVEASKQAGLR
jgi:hypothetical protein